MKKKIAILLNLLVVVMEIAGLAISLKMTGRFGIEYYTEQSNLLALVASSEMLAVLIFGRKVPAFLKWLKYTATLGLAVTFIVTIAVLAPMYEFNYEYLLFHGALVFYHLLCPIIGVVSFIVFEKVGELKRKDTMLSMIWTVAYAVSMVILNIIGAVRGPYPFLMVTEQPVLASIMWFTVILGGAFGISTGIRKIKERVR